MSIDVSSSTGSAGAPSSVDALADYLAKRIEPVLRAWEEAVNADPELSASDDLSRTEFRDDIPRVLAAFVRTLRDTERSPDDNAPAATLEGSVEHGEHRWEQGYDLREVIVEWRHLQRCLLNELDAARTALPGYPAADFAKAWHVLVNLVNSAVADSAEQFTLLQQKQATIERQDLERTVARFVAVGEHRVSVWSQFSHDMRGQLSLISSAATLLEEPDLDDALRAETLATLQRGVSSFRSMLSTALEDVRTEASQEDRHLETFDASGLLGGLCASSQPLARERRLTLRSRGTETLRVEGDRGKVLRIAQNLLLNALLYTEHGEVAVSWQEDGPASWSFQVRDTGPGLPTRTGDGPLPAKAAGARHGEGLGLLIVRRLCDLLGARLHVETAPGAGTVFTVALPRSYAA